MTVCRQFAPSGGRAGALPEPSRAALYYAPEADDPLWSLGSAWLGRDPETGAALTQPLPRLAAVTAAPRRYGFHATLKAPISLRYGFEAFAADAASFAAQCPGFSLPPLAVTSLSGFLALCFSAPCQDMQNLAAGCVSELDAHRVPEDEAIQAKRAAGRTERQRQYIARWGYPLVLEEFQFHMTLTGELADNSLAKAASAFFAPALALPRRVSSLGLFVEDTPGAPFRLVRRLKLAS